MIPKIIHQYWTGDPMPEQYRAWSEAWTAMNPGWTHYLWSDEALNADGPFLRNDALHRRAADYVEASRVGQFRADLVRYELLHRFGGVWIDADFEPLKPLDSWFAELDGDRPFAVWEVQDEWIANGMMGAPAGDPFINHLITRLPASAAERRGQAPTRISGPQFLTVEHLRHGEPLQVLGPERFFPYSWRDLGGPKAEPPWPDECVAVHHWHNKRRQRARNRRRRGRRA